MIMQMSLRVPDVVCKLGVRWVTIRKLKQERGWGKKGG